MLLSLLLALCAPDASATENGLAAVWRTPAPPATWIVVLESTPALKSAAEAAREPIARFVEALPAGDRVEIIAIHARSSSALPLRTVDDAGRAALVEEIRKLQIPAAKASDLGAGLTAVGASVHAAPPDGPRFVLYMGSFCHSPPLGSVWADGGYGCRAIRSFDKLQQTYDSTPGHDLVSATLFPIATPEQPVNDRGVADIRAFFEPSGAVQVVTEPFAAWMETLRGRVHDERLRPMARDEAETLTLSVEVVKQPTLEDPRAELALSSGLVNLAFEATNLVVDGARYAGGPLTLSPKGTLVVDVDIPEAPFSILPRSDTVELPVKITVDGRVTPAESLAAVGIDPARTGLTAEVSLLAGRQYGLSPARSGLIFFSGFLFVGAASLVVRRRVKPLRLGGSFSWRKAGGPRQTLPIEHLAEAALVVRPDGTLALGRREDAVLVLWVERPLWNARATVEIRVPNAEINTKPVTTGRHEVVAGATSLQFLDYRLSWE